MQRNRANSFLLIYNKHPKRDCNELQYCTVVNVKYQIHLYIKKEQFNVSIHKQTQAPGECGITWFRKRHTVCV